MCFELFCISLTNKPFLISKSDFRDFLWGGFNKISLAILGNGLRFGYHIISKQPFQRAISAVQEHISYINCICSLPTIRAV